MLYYLGITLCVSYLSTVFHLVRTREPETVTTKRVLAHLTNQALMSSSALIVNYFLVIEHFPVFLVICFVFNLIASSILDDLISHFEVGSSCKECDKFEDDFLS
jgi:predicted membrane channel-forming protein YqfA (hemolysin III family)